jgi:hypothetical protein
MMWCLHQQFIATQVEGPFITLRWADKVLIMAGSLSDTSGSPGEPTNPINPINLSSERPLVNMMEGDTQISSPPDPDPAVELWDLTLSLLATMATPCWAAAAAAVPEVLPAEQLAAPLLLPPLLLQQPLLEAVLC